MHRNADYRKRKDRRHHARKVRRHTGTGNNDLQSAFLRAVGIIEKFVRFLSHSFSLIALIRQRHMKYKKIEFPHRHLGNC